MERYIGDWSSDVCSSDLTQSSDPTPKKLIEVYPHVALLRLVRVGYRVPYKTSRSRRYMSAGTVAERISFLWVAMTKILTALGNQFEIGRASCRERWRDTSVTGVQTCALPISRNPATPRRRN